MEERRGTVDGREEEMRKVEQSREEEGRIIRVQYKIREWTRACWNIGRCGTAQYIRVE